MSRIGVFVCHCGHNIAGVVDVTRVVEQVKQHPDVVFATDYKYMCSDPGQQLIRESIQQHNLDGVVVAACSPAMHRELRKIQVQQLLIQCTEQYLILLQQLQKTTHTQLRESKKQC